MVLSPCRRCSSEAESDDTVGKMKVSALLESVPGVGKVRARQIMERLWHRGVAAGPAAWVPTRAPRWEAEFRRGRTLTKA